MSRIVSAQEPEPAPQDHRHTVDIASPPWSAVGKLYNGIGGGCTAVAVAKNEVLTAAHCLFNHRTGRFLPSDSLHFLLGLERGDYQLHAVVHSYQLSTRYDPYRPFETLASDWAVLNLQAPLPDNYEPIPLSQESVVGAGTAVMTGGYGQDRRFMLTADTNCRILQPVAGGQLLAHDCRAAKGYSGAPILHRISTGQIEVIAVNVATAFLKGELVMIAVPVTAIRRELRENRSGAHD
jgi:protease YdgD